MKKLLTIATSMMLVVLFSASAQAVTCIEGGNVTLSMPVTNTEPDLAGFRVYRSTTGIDGEYDLISGTTLVPLPSIPGNPATYVDANLPDGEYTPFYKYTAVDTCGNESGFSPSSAGTVRHDTVAPATPTEAPQESVTP